MDTSTIQIPFEAICFYLFSAMTLGFGALVAFGRNLIYSAFGLLGCFAGIAALYILLAADFVGILQLFVYVGGITVLVVFAVMFTNEIGHVEIANQSMNWKSAVPTVGVLFGLLYYLIDKGPWVKRTDIVTGPTTEKIGDLLLTEYLLPFELISILLLVALIGAIVIARRDRGASES